MIVEGIEFRLSKPELRALLTFASTDITRPHLCAVLFDAARAEVAATDACRLAVLAAKPSSGGTASLVDRKHLDGVLRRMNIRDTLTVVCGERVQLRVTDRYGAECVAIDVDPSEETFPPYRQIIPKHTIDGQCKRATPAIGFNAYYLADLALVARATDNMNVLMLPPADPLGPVVFLAHGTTMQYPGNWTLVLMPCRL